MQYCLCLFCQLLLRCQVIVKMDLKIGDKVTNFIRHSELCVGMVEKVDFQNPSIVRVKWSSGSEIHYRVNLQKIDNPLEIFQRILRC